MIKEAPHHDRNISTTTRINVTRSAGNIGAETSGIDTASVLGDESGSPGAPGAARPQRGFLRGQDLLADRAGGAGAAAQPASAARQRGHAQREGSVYLYLR
jgi:hypothetical protein